jgi:opacity protein-like surface antigen
MMGSTKALLLAGVVALGAATAAHAADLPPPAYVPLPEPVQFGGWYLRGDVGVGITSSPRIRSTFDAAAVVPGFNVDQQTLGDAAFVGLGVGYQVNNWLRFDATGEYRTSQHFEATESENIGFFNTPPDDSRAFDRYTASVQSSVFLVNAYADLGTWYSLTPFIGGGVGAAFNRISGLNDIGLTPGFQGLGFAREKDSTSLAWAVMAGIDYAVSPNLKLELGYRYLNMGTAKSNPIVCLAGCTGEIQRYRLEAQDIRLGMRWLISDTTPAPAYYPAPEAPIVRKY